MNPDDKLPLKMSPKTINFIQGWTPTNGGNVNLSGGAANSDPAILRGSVHSLAGQLNCTGESQIHGPSTFTSTSDLAITGPSDRLRLFGDNTLNFGTNVTGAGSLTVVDPYTLVLPDDIVVQPNLTLAGTLELSNTSGSRATVGDFSPTALAHLNIDITATPVVGQRWTILAAPSVTGIFASVTTVSGTDYLSLSATIHTLCKSPDATLSVTRSTNLTTFGPAKVILHRPCSKTPPTSAPTPGARPSPSARSHRSFRALRPSSSREPNVSPLPIVRLDASRKRARLRGIRRIALADQPTNQSTMKTRRDFLRTAAAAAILSPTLVRGESDKLGKILPQREFGKTGVMVTAFGLGGYHIGVSGEGKTAQAIIERAIERGVRFFDNAVSYHKGGSEKYYGDYLTPKYRDQIFLTTKSSKTTAKDVEKDFEDSLGRMKTDYLDLWQIHSLGSVEDVKERIKNGVVEVFLKKREEKKARYIGFTGHASQEAHCYFLDFCKKQGYQMDSCLMPVNLFDTHYDSFLINVLPKLQEQGIALQAMKTMVFGKVFIRSDELDPGIITPKNMHEYAYSLPVACMLSGCETVAQVDENTAILMNFKGMDEERRNQLVAAVEKISGPKLEYYKRKA